MEEFPAYKGGLLTEFSWVLRKLLGPMNIALNPDHENGFDMDEEMVASLISILPPGQTMNMQTAGKQYLPGITSFSETARYRYHDGMHDLALFWTRPTLKEKLGFEKQPVAIALYVEQSVLFILYRINDTCEWSDVAFNIRQIPEAERIIPDEAPGTPALLQLTLVNADSGIILTQRLLHLPSVLTQGLRHTLNEQMHSACSRQQYENQIKLAYERYPDSDVMLKNAWMIEDNIPDIVTVS